MLGLWLLASVRGLYNVVKLLFEITHTYESCSPGYKYALSLVYIWLPLICLCRFDPFNFISHFALCHLFRFNHAHLENLDV